MGSLLTTLGTQMNKLVCLYQNRFENPISFVRAGDYNAIGLLRDDAYDNWIIGIQKMVYHEHATRDLLLPIINKRVQNYFASQKYNLSDIDYLLYKFPEWDEKRIFNIHDLFQVFEVDGDGLIEITEMTLGLDNLSDKTPNRERVKILASADDDETGVIDFEEFLAVIYDLEVISEDKEHPLKRTFAQIDADVQFIRLMSIVQQIRAGFL